MDINLDKVVRRKQLLELIGLRCATQWRMEKAGLFPERIELGKGSVGWHLTEVEEWLKDRERVLRHPVVARDRLRRATDRLGVDSNLSLGQGGVYPHRAMCETGEESGSTVLGETFTQKFTRIKKVLRPKP